MRIALDTETPVLLQERGQRYRERLAAFGMELTDDIYVFSGIRNVDPSKPYSPHAVSSRYADMAERLGIDIHIHALRHYSATELLAACTAAGVVLGDFDRHIVDWLSDFEPTTVQVLVGIIGCAAQGGRR